ncbi:MAG: LuxR C-terminal-related transcriptional regulator [Pseudomonadales bacterium]
MGARSLVHGHKSVVIADDHAIIRNALDEALTRPGRVAVNGLKVVAHAENGFEAVAAVKRHKPDLLLLDVAMPLASGAQIINDVRRWSADTYTVVFTGVEAAGLLFGLIEDGVRGLFSKADPIEYLLDKIPHILDGSTYVAPRFSNILETQNAVAALTPRERQTLNMVVAGKNNREIAEAMNVSAKTVDKHRTSLMNKLDVHSVVELISLALREGLLDDAHSVPPD